MSVYKGDITSEQSLPNRGRNPKGNASKGSYSASNYRASSVVSNDHPLSFSDKDTSYSGAVKKNTGEKHGRPLPGPGAMKDKEEGKDLF